MTSVKGVFKELWWFRSTIIMIGVPLLLALMLPFSEQMGMSQKACNCLYMLLLMAIYWITETFHLSVTSLIPLVLSPMLSIQTAPDIAKNYFKDVGTLYLGGLMVAAAIEHSQLHRRMALSILKLCGTNPRFLMLGFMIPSWFLSMWISNSATAAMMVTIALAVISQLEESEKQLYRKSRKKDTNSLKLNNNDLEMAESGVDDTDGAPGVNNPSFDPETKPDSQSADDLNKNNIDSLSSDGDSDTGDDEFEGKWVEMGKGILMATAYSASIGGIATITGTFSNLIFQENLASISKEALGNHDFGVRFATWIGFGMPISIVMLFLAWNVLQIVFIGVRCNVQSEEERTQIQNIVDTAYNGLGPMKFKEVVAVIHFAMLALLWIGRNPGGSGGWGSLFTEGYVSDGTAAVFVVLSMFMWPGELPDFCCSRGGCGIRKRVSRKPFITWNELAQKVQWGLLMLLGGGFALADSITVSGLSKVLGEALNFFDGWPVWGVVVCLSAITSLLTEITTNAAISTIFMPIAARMAVDVKMNPVYFMLPVCVGASYSFMLPVATGPNALVYASGRLSIKDMVKAGWILNILGVGVATLFTLTWSQVIFKMDNISFNNTVNLNLTSNV